MPGQGSAKKVLSELDATRAYADQRIRFRVERREVIEADLHELLNRCDALTDRRVVFEASVAHLVFWTYELDSLGLDEVGHRTRRKWLPLAFREEDESQELCAEIAHSYADVWDAVRTARDTDRLAAYGDHFVRRCLARRIGPRTVPVLRALPALAGKFLVSPSGFWWEGFLGSYEIAPQSASAPRHEARQASTVTSEPSHSSHAAEAMARLKQELTAAASAVLAQAPETRGVYENNKESMNNVAYLWARALAPTATESDAAAIGSYMATLSFMSAWYASHGLTDRRDAASHAGAGMVSAVGFEPAAVFRGLLVLEREWDAHLKQAGIGRRSGCAALALLVVLAASGAALAI